MLNRVHPKMSMAILLIFATAMPAFGRDYYVRPSGNDDGPGTADEPFETVTTGVYALAAGDTLYIGSGIYYEGELYPDANGMPDAPITIRNVPGETPILDGQYALWQFLALTENDWYVVQGLVVRNYFDIGISCRNVGHITIRECTCYGNGSCGIGLNYAEYPHAAYNAHMIVEDNVCYENGWGIGWASGIHINNKWVGENSSHIIRRNICYNNVDGSSYHTDGNGIMFDVGGGGACLIENNLCFNNGGAGIRAMDGHVTIVNNTCFRNAWDPDNEYQPCEIELIERHLAGSIAGSVVCNNIAWARPQRDNDGTLYGGPFIAQDVPTSDFEFANNVLWSDVPAQVVIDSWMNHCVKQSPGFLAYALDDTLTTIHGGTHLLMSLESYDFHLRPDSPAVNAARQQSAPTEDLDGAPRPWSGAVDCGAYEYVADGDCDGDGQTRPTDWASLTPCLFGPTVELLSGCVCLDLDGDADVDLTDLAAFQQLVDMP